LVLVQPDVLTEEQYELKKQAELYKQLVDQKTNEEGAEVRGHRGCGEEQSYRCGVHSIVM